MKSGKCKYYWVVAQSLNDPKIQCLPYGVILNVFPCFIILIPPLFFCSLSFLYLSVNQESHYIGTLWPQLLIFRFLFKFLFRGTCTLFRISLEKKVWKTIQWQHEQMAPSLEQKWNTAATRWLFLIKFLVHPPRPIVVPPIIRWVAFFLT